MRRILGTMTREFIKDKCKKLSNLIEPYLDRLSINTQNIASRYGIPKEQTDNVLSYFISGAKGYYDYYYGKPNTEIKEDTPNTAFGIGTLGSTPANGMNSNDISPVSIGDNEQPLLNKRRGRKKKKENYSIVI